MGSVKDLVRDDSPAGKLYIPPNNVAFGRGVWRVSGRFSVGDLKSLIPDVNIKDKAEALTMSTAAFFEWLAKTHPDIPTCYLGVLDKDGKMTDTTTLLDRGEKTNLIVMKLAHVPDSFCGGNLEVYREALKTGRLECGVADIESIFRHGFPLGSSTFEKIFEAAGMKDRYETLATYEDTVRELNYIRRVTRMGVFPPKLTEVLKNAGLRDIPNPGHVLTDIVYDTTTKFEVGGDRRLDDERETQELSGLDEEGYEHWKNEMFPELARAQIAFCAERGILNIDGKAECIAYHRAPIVTDFVCTVDENRLMIVTKIGGVDLAIPSNKEIQRAYFRQQGVYAAISEAKRVAEAKGENNRWREYMPQMLKDRGIDLKAVSEHSCSLMANAIGEVANRTLGQKVFDAPPLGDWVLEFLPYASRVEEEK
jgi:phosphoribosylaminoimidazole-succinocarboxamide synthase